MAGSIGFTHDSCEKECKAIHDTTDRLSQLVRAMACRTGSERRQIRETYKAMYGDDLLDLLDTVYAASQRNEICSLLSLWMLDPHERDALVAREALEHSDTDYKALTEIYSGRKSSHIILIQHAYMARFRRNLEQDINSEPPHPYQRILVALATSHKSHDTSISQHVAKNDAKRFYEAGEGRPGGAMDESVVLEILSKRSIPQLKLIFSSYKHIYGHDFTKSLKKETCGQFEDCLRVTVKCLYTPAKYYAKMLYTSIKGTVTNNTVLARVLVSRAEMDMNEIRGIFENKYRMTIHHAICESIPNGDYRNFLAALAASPFCTS